jgi:hypothetical protein
MLNAQMCTALRSCPAACRTRIAPRHRDLPFSSAHNVQEEGSRCSSPGARFQQELFRTAHCSRRTASTGRTTAADLSAPVFARPLGQLGCGAVDAHGTFFRCAFTIAGSAISRRHSECTGRSAAPGMLSGNAKQGFEVRRGWWPIRDTLKQAANQGEGHRACCQQRTTRSRRNSETRGERQGPTAVDANPAELDQSRTERSFVALRISEYTP